MKNYDYISKSEITKQFLLSVGCRDMTVKSFIDKVLPLIPSRVEIRGNPYNERLQKHCIVWNINDIKEFIKDYRPTLLME